MIVRLGGQDAVDVHASFANDDQAPICPACGVTMVPGVLAAQKGRAGEWVCLECEETDETSVDG